MNIYASMMMTSEVETCSGVVVHNNSIQFNLFTCKLNSSEANYKASTSRNEKTHTYKQYKNKAIIIIIIIIMQIIIIIIIIIIIQFFIIYVPSQQLLGQLQTHHSVDTGTNN
jgi:hypothetical protein